MNAKLLERILNIRTTTVGILVFVAALAGGLAELLQGELPNWGAIGAGLGGITLLFARD